MGGKRILVASDIQGNWEDYRTVKSRFEELKRQGKADVLVFDGDLVHGYNGYEDRSVDILGDLIDNPNPAVISLLGNHEFMHIYHKEVSKAGHSFTEPLEEKIEHDREKYVGFMKQMPYAIRTAGGVLINHTGANPPMAGFVGKKAYQHLVGSQGFQILNGLDHDKVLKQVTGLTRKILEQQYEHPLADDFFENFTPQIGQVFAQIDIGAYLWDVFFNKNERQYGDETYTRMLTGFLETMSQGNKPQRFVVTGHIEVPDGYAVIDGKQLRICSSYGADEGKKVLSLVDASKPYESVDQLVDDLQPVYK